MEFEDHYHAPCLQQDRTGGPCEVLRRLIPPVGKVDEAARPASQWLDQGHSVSLIVDAWGLGADIENGC